MNSRHEMINAGRLDFERLRAGQNRLSLPDGDLADDSLPSFLGRVVTSETSVKVGRFIKVVPSTVLGTEREGGSGNFSANGGSSPPVLVYLMGSFVPMPGDFVVCRFVDHRWVTELSGGGSSHGQGIVLGSCFCLLPPVLRMTSGDPNCNYAMFQSCTLAYGPPPPAMRALNFTENLFSSSATFVDPITNSSFFYYFACLYNQFFLTRIFPSSPLGNPYRDGILYNWIVGGYGNTCQPFRLEYGMPFPGSDATCSVTISGD